MRLQRVYKPVPTIVVTKILTHRGCPSAPPLLPAALGCPSAPPLLPAAQLFGQLELFDQEDALAPLSFHSESDTTSRLSRGPPPLDRDDGGDWGDWAVERDVPPEF